MKKQIMILWCSVVVMVATVAGLPSALHALEGQRTVLTSTVLPCVSVAHLSQNI